MGKSSVERSLILIKPDAFQRGLIGEVIARFERRGLRIMALKMMTLPNALAKKHYAEHAAKPFFRELVDFITSGPAVAMVVQGPNAVEICRTLIGATDAAKATPGSIRGDLGLTIGRNLVHGADSTESAEREIQLFFEAADFVQYERSLEPWIIE